MKDQTNKPVTKQDFINTVGMMQAGSTYDRVGELCLELAEKLHLQKCDKAGEELPDRDTIDKESESIAKVFPE